MKKSLIKSIGFLFLLLGSCKNSIPLKTDKEVMAQPNQVFLKIIGTAEEGEPVEIITLYLDQQYHFRFFTYRENMWHERRGFVPDPIFSTIIRKGLRSKLIKNREGIATYEHPTGNTLIKHPPGIGELLGFLHAGK